MIRADDNLKQIRPELATAYRKIPSFELELGLRLLLTRVVSKFPIALSPATKAVTKRKVSQSAGHMLIQEPKRSPEGLRWGILMLHGGGMVMGGPNSGATTTAAVAAGMNAVVVSPSYRLAPEHPHPAALDDCMDSWKWMLDNASDLNIDPSKTVIAGWSAGGAFAATLVQRLKHERGTLPKAQALLYPMLDDRTASDRELDGKHLVWENQKNRFGWSAYLKPHKPGDETLPLFASAARHEDLSDLPPTWIGVGSMDLFARECKEYARKLESAGVDTHLEVVPGAPHGFDLVAPKARVSKMFLASLMTFLDSC